MLSIIFSTILRWIGSIVEQCMLIWGAIRYGREKQRREQAEAELQALNERRERDAEIRRKRRQSILNRDSSEL